MIILTTIISALAILAIVIIAAKYKPEKLLDISSVYEKKVSFKKVFISNIKLVSLNVFIGIFSFGIYGIIVMIQNIIALGTISSELISNGMIALVVKMIPHGLIEIWGMTFSIIIPFIIYLRIFRDLKKVIAKEKSIMDVIKEMLKFIIKVIIALIIIFIFAAIIEVIVSRIKFM